MGNCESDDVIISGKDAKSVWFIMIFENIIIWTSCSNQKTALHTIIQTDLQLGKTSRKEICQQNFEGYEFWNYSSENF